MCKDFKKTIFFNIFFCVLLLHQIKKCVVTTIVIVHLIECMHHGYTWDVVRKTVERKVTHEQS